MNDAKPRVVLGVGGGIAAYKACEVLRGLTESGHDVRVVPTEAALNFVGAATFEALSGNPVHTGVFTEVPEVQHVRVGKEADLVLVVPATANLLAKAAHGLADDLLTNTLLTARCPVAFFPAMHTEMWEHPATRDNVALLRSRGLVVTEPAMRQADRRRHRQGTARRSGRDRRPGPAAARRASRAAARPRGPPRGDLRGRHPRTARPGPLPGQPIVGQTGLRARPGRRATRRRGDAGRRAHRRTAVSGGRDAATSVHRRGNAQSGARRRGGRGCRRDGRRGRGFPARDSQADHKIKKSDDSPDPVITLDRNADILAEVVQGRRSGQIVVGFAAETGDENGSVLDHARAKLRRKGADLLVVNAVGDGKAFGTEDNSGWLLAADGTEQVISQGAKARLAATLWDAVTALIERRL